MKTITVVLIGLGAGFAGGILATGVMRTREQLVEQPILRTRSFELINEAGQTISYWGIDKGQNAVLAFGKAGTLPDHPGIAAGDPRKQRLAVGLIDDNPFLIFRGPDGNSRVRLLLNLYEQPMLVMEDRFRRGLSLGVEQSDTPGPQDNNWTLIFYPETARIGLVTEKDRGESYVRGVLYINKERIKSPDGPSR